jgi:uncharacterized protein YutE (UPF0331/DUF86 family)
MCKCIFPDLILTCSVFFSLLRYSVLIDDRIALAADWVSKGGIFIHHTDTERTLQQLREHGIIDEEEDKKIASTV